MMTFLFLVSFSLVQAVAAERIVATMDRATLDSGSTIYQLSWGGARVLKEAFEHNDLLPRRFVCLEALPTEEALSQWPRCYWVVRNQEFLVDTEVRAILNEFKDKFVWSSVGFGSVEHSKTEILNELRVFFDHGASQAVLGDFGFKDAQSKKLPLVFEVDGLKCEKKLRRTRTRSGGLSWALARWRCEMSFATMKE